MPQATLTLTIPDGIWAGEVTRRYETAEIHVLAALAGDESGVALAKITHPDLPSVISDIRTADAVTDFAVLERRENGVLVQVETVLPILLEPARRSGIPLEMPFTVRNGEVVWEVTASHDRLSTLHDQLDQFGISFTVDSVYGELDSTESLTPQQWDVLTVAVREGYYDTPRRCTQEDVAEKLGLAKSTCSETLHRAEERIIKQFIDRRTNDADRKFESVPLPA